MPSSTPARANDYYCYNAEIPFFPSARRAPSRAAGLSHRRKRRASDAHVHLSTFMPTNLDITPISRLAGAVPLLGPLGLLSLAARSGPPRVTKSASWDFFGDCAGASEEHISPAPPQDRRIGHFKAAAGLALREDTLSPLKNTTPTPAVAHNITATICSFRTQALKRTRAAVTRSRPSVA